MAFDLKEIYDLMSEPTDQEKDLIGRAFDFAQKAHQGQKRLSGEPYISHPFAVGKILASLKADSETIVAGLIHDTLEDTPITTDDIKKEFGGKVLFLVEGVTKLGKIKYQGLERHVESLRKFFMAMAQDIRVVIIRLADRLHNIQTLQYVPEHKQKRIALETIEIYAPIANRLGIWKLKGALEDGSFPYIYPKEYAMVVKLRKTKGRETIKRLNKIYRQLNRELVDKGFKDFQIDYRIKYLYSLYMKLKQNNMDIEKIYDISAIRIIVNSIEDCYQVLGIIHAKWRPAPGKLKDYIALPKPNGYQSIHTGVFTGDGIIEIQIRTKVMHYEAEYGIASHLAYDESGKKKTGGKFSKKVQWLSDLLEAQKKVADGKEFLDLIKGDFFKEHIFVFTPKGDVIELPINSTVLDFAYAIHSDIGDHTAGAIVNNKFVSLDTILHNNDIVTIEVKEKNHPSRRWFNYIKTNNAKRHIRLYIQNHQSDRFGLLQKFNPLKKKGRVKQ